VTSLSVDRHENVAFVVKMRLFGWNDLDETCMIQIARIRKWEASMGVKR
jgi:hypothetical protein